MRRAVVMVMAAALLAVFSGCSDDESGTGDEQQEQEASCPVGTSSGGSCSGSESCSIGEESCCFQTYAATVCQCMGGQWSCYATDACLGAAVEGYCSCPAGSECEDPAPGAPNYQCEDGSTGGPVCEQTGVETCGWTIRVCPEER